ncbi:ABC transporter substrate-binding protein [Glaciihabitans arcticus]|uniref:ABC transporter substrate-binding protein n=1 Tax=Glaciihabitans arcticus TaxID=2668039 RepID=A0A4V2JF20_9MICO|nr:ABC transporter substrate-binding protein [Glaciihabitans arcticus]TBN57719.1 ABC transporter substrate-binding protein [Glaciihabitans arcticus]
MHRFTAARPIAAVAAVAAVIALSGCGASQQGATTLDKDAKVELTWWTGQSEQAQTMLEDLAAEFEKDHPNVTIDVSPGSSSTEELLQKISAGFAGGSYPDISYAFGSWASQLESSGRTLDITEQVTDPEVKWDEFSESARGTVQPTGEKTIGFPAIVDNLSLIYNKTVFDEAGVEYPTEDWSWDDFREAADDLTDESTNTYGYAYSVSGSEETVWQFWPHLWQEGGDILDDEGLAAFDSEAGVRALTLLQEMAIDDKSIYLDQTDTKFAQLFASDRIGMMTSGPWQLYDLNTAKTDYGVVQLPGTDGDHQTVSGPDIWALFDHKDKNREYWSYEFTKWLTSAEQDERWNVAIGNLPLRSSEVDSDAFKEQVEAYPGLDVMAANNENAINVRPTIKGYVGLSESIGNAISEVLQGQGEPKAALEEAAEKANTTLK